MASEVRGRPVPRGRLPENPSSLTLAALPFRKFWPVRLISKFRKMFLLVSSESQQMHARSHRSELIVSCDSLTHAPRERAQGDHFKSASRCGVWDTQNTRPFRLPSWPINCARVQICGLRFTDRLPALKARPLLACVRGIHCSDTQPVVICFPRAIRHSRCHHRGRVRTSAICSTAMRSGPVALGTTW